MRSVGRKTRRASDFDLLYRLSAPVLSCALGVAALEIANNPDAVQVRAVGKNIRTPRLKTGAIKPNGEEVPFGAPSFSPYRSLLSVLWIFCTLHRR